MSRYVVRKLDTESQWFYVVDTKVPRHTLIAPESVVARYPSWLDAHRAADTFNGQGPK
jgi:hypothetical protein